MSLTIDGVWKAGVWATTVWADGVWREGAYEPPASAAGGSLESSGGLMSWKRPERVYFRENERRGIAPNQSDELIDEAQQAIERAAESKDSKALVELESVSKRLQNGLVGLKEQVEEYRKQLGDSAAFAGFSAKMEAQRQELMIQAAIREIQAKEHAMRRQIEEIDVMFVAMVLLAS